MSAADNLHQHAIFHTSAFESNGTRLYLRVEVFPTAYPYQTAQYVTIYLNGVEIMPYCAPGIECGTDFFVCLADYDVTEHVLPNNGGSLAVGVTSTGVLPSICDYNGYPLFMRFTVHDTDDPQTQAPSIFIEENDSNSHLSSFNLSYHVQPGFMLTLAIWGLVGALCGGWAARFRNSTKVKDLVVTFKW